MNKAIDKLPKYINLKVIIILIFKILRLYIVSNKINYNIILERP